MERRSINNQEVKECNSNGVNSDQNGSLLKNIMNKRLSINPSMVKQYSTLVRLQAESERGNPNSETESVKSLKPSESTKLKPRKSKARKKKNYKNNIGKQNDLMQSHEVNYNMKSLLSRRHTKVAPAIEGLSYKKSNSRSSSPNRELSSEFCGTAKPHYRKLEETQAEGRCDRFGTLIISGSKEHRICFRDEIGEGKVDIIKEVESYKTYYKSKTFISCSCNIF
ncbi:unnamed protein product [Moneuplotes crassus]|uniref:Uncharacterized protein n=1 Tax=Euplotes crassus TaxID=5936 RepID=A0AAD1XN46_EUPCR|nr:unnamed protein product [Moneuplotes crassus]